jgi:hypothetical protein
MKDAIVLNYIEDGETSNVCRVTQKKDKQKNRVVKAEVLAASFVNLTQQLSTERPYTKIAILNS